jgi:hypothetical protein
VALFIAGIDEAGYGPLLGPLCVGLAALRVDPWQEGGRAPDLWTLLGQAVCRAGPDARGRVAIDDSKKLKLPNDGARHPLTHLERGVMSFLASRGDRPASEGELLALLGARVDQLEWYRPGGEQTGAACKRFPRASTHEQIGIAGNTIASAMRAAGVSLERLACRAVPEPVFNQVVRSAGTKAAATAMVIGEFLQAVWFEHAATQGLAVRIVCDRQGGRTDYERYLAGLVPGAKVQTLEQTAARARYQLEGSERRMVVQFQTEAEKQHLPVALASMTAKLVRELLMERFNDYWCSRLPELKPTAGYAQDGRRWLADLKGVLTPAERELLVRIA